MLPHPLSIGITSGVVPSVTESVTAALTEALSISLADQLSSSFKVAIAPVVSDGIGEKLLPTLPPALIVRYIYYLLLVQCVCVTWSSYVA